MAFFLEGHYACVHVLPQSTMTPGTLHSKLGKQDSMHERCAGWTAVRHGHLGLEC